MTYLTIDLEALVEQNEKSFDLYINVKGYVSATGPTTFVSRSNCYRE
jgi:hypothetical protein